MVRFSGVGILAAFIFSATAIGALASEVMDTATEAAGTVQYSVAEAGAWEVVRSDGIRVCQVAVKVNGKVREPRPTAIEFRYTRDASVDERLNFLHYCYQGGDVEDREVPLRSRH